MAICSVTRKYPKATIREALDAPLPYAPFRDHSWKWWNVLQLSGLAHHWDGFRDIAQTQNVRKATQWLRKQVTKDEWDLLKRRLGKNPHHSNHAAKRGTLLWTKGGTWRADSNFAKILVLKEHLPPRPQLHRWQFAMHEGNCRLLESELMHRIDPDTTLITEAKKQAIQYVRRRLPDFTKSGHARASLAAVAWFFQTSVRAGPKIIWPQADGSTRTSRDYRYTQQGWEW